MNVTVEHVDLGVITGYGYRCGSCHCPIEPGEGVTFGHPALMFPAINVCRRCVNIAATAVGPIPTEPKKGESKL